MPVNQRPRIPRHPRLRTRHQRTKRDLQQGQEQQDQGTELDRSRRSLVSPRRKPRRHHHEQRENHGRRGQMQHQLDRRDRNHALFEPGRHHDPADHRLHPAQRPNTKHAQCAPPPERTKPERRHKTRCKHQPDQAAQLPVRPFPPENRLELAKAHPLVQQFILRDRLIFRERVRPILRRQRRNSPHNRPPFRDRQA